MNINIFIFIILVFYLNNFISKKNIKKIENFSFTSDFTALKKEILEKCVLSKYDFPYESFKNLGKITGTLIWEDMLRLPFDVKADELNLLTKGMIIAYLPTENEKKSTLDALKISAQNYGWGICDGTTYKYKNNSIKTPNLSDKFVFGSSSSKGLNNEDYRKNGNKNGKEKVKLSYYEMPIHNHGGNTNEVSHNHSVQDFVTLNSGKPGRIRYPSPGGNNLHDSSSEGYNNFILRRTTTTRESEELNGKKEDHTHIPSFEGNNVEHNNMPPYIKLLYMMKL